MSRFNIRVYGLWMNEDNEILVSEENIKGKTVIKFPGGGMELGEGTIDCLKREWMEELGVEIQILKHYYTTDFYQPSANDNSQVISIYYEVKPLQSIILPYNNTNETIYFLPLSEKLPQKINLPIDKVVAEMLVSDRM